jgi:ATPase subunit of ABC transporter with duplicated ATPase domains
MDALRLPPRRPKSTSWVRCCRRSAAFAEARLLLLDEPTNHLDAESVVARASPVEYPGIVAITHDRY